MQSARRSAEMSEPLHAELIRDDRSTAPELKSLQKLADIARRLDMEAADPVRPGPEIGHAAIQRTLLIWVGDGSGMHDQIRKFGRRFDASPLPTSFAIGRPEKSFDNALAAFLVARKAGIRDVRYVEGLAASPTAHFVPLHHAWVVDGSNRAIDTTWSDCEGSAYFGIAFAADFVMERYRLLKRRWGPVLENPSRAGRLGPDNWHLAIDDYEGHLRRA